MNTYLRACFLFILLNATFSPVFAEEIDVSSYTDEEITYELSIALAEIDFARELCPKLKINEKELKVMLEKLNKTEAAIRETEDYKEQLFAMKQAREYDGPLLTACDLVGSNSEGEFTERLFR